MTLPEKETKHTNIEFDEDLGTLIKSIVDNINKKYNVKVLLIKTSIDITIFQSF